MTSKPPRRVRRLQGGAVIAGLVASVVATSVLVASPGPLPRVTSPASAEAPVRLPGTRVAIEGGNPFTTYELADRLAASGARIGPVAPSTGTAIPDDETVILYYERTQMETATRVRAMLGQGTLRRRQVFRPGVDVTIVLGKDLSHL